MNSPQRKKGSVWYENTKLRRPSEDSIESNRTLNVAHTMQYIEGHLGQSGTTALTTNRDIYDTPDKGSDGSFTDDDPTDDLDDEFLDDGSDFSDGVRIYDDPFDEGESGNKNVDEQVYEIDIFEGGAGASSGAGAPPGTREGAWSSSSTQQKLKTFSVTKSKAPGGYEIVETNPPPIPVRPPQVTMKDINQMKGKVALQPPRKQHMKRTENDSFAEQSRPNPNDPGIEPSCTLQLNPRSTPSSPLSNELASRIAKRAKALSPPAARRKESPFSPTIQQGSDTAHDMESDKGDVLPIRLMGSDRSKPGELRHTKKMNPTTNPVPIADELVMKLSNRIRAMKMDNGTEGDVKSSSHHHGSYNSFSPDQTPVLTRATNLRITEEIGGRQLYHNVDIQHGFHKDQEEEGPISPSHVRVNQIFDRSKSAKQPSHGRRTGSSNEEHGAINVSLRDAQNHNNALPIPKVLQQKKALVPPPLPTKNDSFEPRTPVTEQKTAKQPKSPAPKPAPKPPVLFDETYENTEIGQHDVRPMPTSTKLGNSHGGVEQDVHIPRKHMRSMTGTVVFSDKSEAVLIERTDLQEYLHVGDQVLQIAGINVRNSCAAFVTECWKRTCENPVRVKVLRW